MTTTTDSKKALQDLELVNTIRNSEKSVSDKAFEKLFNKYHDSIMFHFRGITNDEETSREMALEAFVKMSKNLSMFDEKEGAFSTWFFALTKRLFIDTLRKKKDLAISITDLGSSDDEGNTIGFEVKSNERTPEEKMISFEKNKKILEIVNNMGNDLLRDVIKMRYFDDMSYEQIAQKIERPLGTVKASINRAKEVLKNAFIQSGVAY